MGVETTPRPPMSADVARCRPVSAPGSRRPPPTARKEGPARSRRLPRCSRRRHAQPEKDDSHETPVGARARTLRRRHRRPHRLRAADADGDGHAHRHDRLGAPAPRRARRRDRTAGREPRRSRRGRRSDARSGDRAALDPDPLGCPAGASRLGARAAAPDGLPASDHPPDARGCEARHRRAGLCRCRQALLRRHRRTRRLAGNDGGSDHRNGGGDRAVAPRREPGDVRGEDRQELRQQGRPDPSRCRPRRSSPRSRR